jgi:hypothetical protein
VINLHHRSVSKFLNCFAKGVNTLVVTFFSLLTFGYAQVNKNTIDWQTTLESSNFVAINNPKKIDQNILSKFPEWKKMSAPHGRFNATDDGNGPHRRLYFIAKADTNWIVSYEHGGRGYHTHCFLITIGSQNNLLIQSSIIEFKSLEYLKLFLRNQKNPFEGWDGYDY